MSFEKSESGKKLEMLFFCIFVSNRFLLVSAVPFISVRKTAGFAYCLFFFFLVFIASVYQNLIHLLMFPVSVQFCVRCIFSNQHQVTHFKTYQGQETQKNTDSTNVRAQFSLCEFTHTIFIQVKENNIVTTPEAQCSLLISTSSNVSLS